MDTAIASLMYRLDLFKTVDHVQSTLANVIDQQVSDQIYQDALC